MRTYIGVGSSFQALKDCYSVDGWMVCNRFENVPLGDSARGAGGGFPVDRQMRNAVTRD